MWVFREGLESSSAHGGACNVTCRGKKHYSRLGLGFLSQKLANLVNEVGVERRCKSGGTLYSEVNHPLK
jgi:hypothetical protein